MMRDKPVSHLIFILLTSILCANVLGEVLRSVLHIVASEGSIVERALLQYVVEWTFGTPPVNLFVMAFELSLSLRFNVITLLGVLAGWYYFKYSY